MTTWVLLRGLARAAHHWGDFPRRLRERIPECDAVVALDLPGNGSLCHARSPASIHALVASVREQLAARQCRPPYLAVSISMGGMVALQWSLAGRDHLRGCVLVNSSLGGMSPFWNRLQPQSYPTLLGLLLPGRGPLSRERAILRLTTNIPSAPELAHDWALHARACPLTRANVLRQLAAAASYRAPATGPGVPALLLASTHDRLVSVGCSRAMARAWDAPLYEHPRAGHDLPLDDPDWVIGHAMRWAARLDRADRAGESAPGR